MQGLPSVLPAAGAGLAAVWIMGAMPRPAELPRYVLTDREAFVLQQPVLAAQPPVAAAEGSPDGRFVLAVRQARPVVRDQPPAGEISLVLWTRRTGQSREVWKQPPGIQAVEQIAWLPATSVALVILNWIQPAGEEMEPRRTLLRVDAAGGQVRNLGELRSDRLIVSPSQPLAVIAGGGDEPSLRILRADGGLSAPIRLHSRNEHWSADGSRLYIQSFERPATPGQRVVPRWSAVDLRTGVVRALADAPSDLFAVKAIPVRLKAAVVTLKEEGTSQRVRPLWLESLVKSEQPRALVCADSEWAQLAPNAGAVLYLSQGAAWVVPLARMPREQALAQFRGVYQAEAMSRAKQIGLAFAMYAQDYDEVFPPAGDKVTDIIRPYVKADEVFLTPGQEALGFVYVLDAPSLATIKDPATTVLGFLPAPGGRAVIYVDGHVEWKND